MLDELYKEIKSCSKCELYKEKKNYVLFRGNPESSLFILGEAPGEQEDEQGLPFVGRAGQCLDRAISSLGFNPNDDCYIANCLKCRPPNNRRPTSNELTSCRYYLDKQIEIIKPKIILALGNTAIQNILNTNEGVSKLRTRIHSYNGTNVYTTYHPSFIIRSGGVSSKYFIDFINDIRVAINESRS